MQAIDTRKPAPLERLHDLTRTAMFAALIAAGAFIVIPIGPAHFTMQTMMIMLTGFCLGPKRAFLAMMVYLAAGFVGLPVFGRGRAGPAAFLAPTGGYYPGFVVEAVVIGLAANVPGGRARRIAAMAAAGLAGTAAMLTIGSTGLALLAIPDWKTAFILGFLPFAPIEPIKLALAIYIREAFYPPRRGTGGLPDA